MDPFGSALADSILEIKPLFYVINAKLNWFFKITTNLDEFLKINDHRIFHVNYVWDFCQIASCFFNEKENYSSKVYVNERLLYLGFS